MTTHPAKFRPIRFAVCIPTRGRWDLFGKTLTKQPFLNQSNVYVGVEHDEYREYMRVFEAVCGGRKQVRFKVIPYNNKEGSVGIAREQLRIAATRDRYDWYVATDDNARYTQEAVTALVQCAEAWRVRVNADAPTLEDEKIPVFMAGMHSTAMHFDRNLIRRKETVDGWTSYPGIGFIFHAMHHKWYAKYRYPAGCFALEDRHMMLSAIDAGHREFRVCMDAPFSKSRYQSGGQGDIPKRQWNCGRAIEQLAHDFPAMVGARGTLPLPWQFILKLRDGATVDRLVGGAMRKGEVIAQHTTMKAKRVKR